MGFWGSKNGAACVACSLIGFLLAHYLFSGVWAIYAYILISYHLFLAWLVITAEHETGFSLPIISTIFTHLACLALVIGFTVVRRYVPFFGLIRYFIPALAPFECTWLFSANTAKLAVEKKKEITVSAVDKAAVARAIATATGDDYEAWTHYLAHRDPRLRKPGMSIKEEYEQWMVVRAKGRS
jgi:hypothetical protein